MIKIKDQFCVSISIGAKKDFILVEDLDEFSITEYSGGLLPTYQLSFITNDESVLAMLNEGQTIAVQYGKDTNSLEDTVLFPGEIRTSKEGDNKRVIEVSGLAVSLSYLTTPLSQISDKMSAVELMIKTAEIDFPRVSSNVTKSLDSQYWIQPGTSNRAFMSHLMLRSNIMPSFIATAIQANGTFIIKDIAKVISENKPKWKFVRGKESSDFINYDADAVMTSRNLYFNQWTGYQKEKKVLNFSTGKIDSVSTEFKPLIAMAKEIDKDSSIPKRFNGFEIMNDNVHENFWPAYDHNLVNLTQMSKVAYALSFQDSYRAIAPLDLAFLTERDTSDRGAASEFTSGLYFVTRITKSVQGARYLETAILNRESVNAARNT